MGWHIRFAAFKGTGISDRGDSIHRPFWSAFLYYAIIGARFYKKAGTQCRAFLV